MNSRYREDIRILRDLAKRYAEIAAAPVQEERRRLWAAHFSRRTSRVPVLVTYGMWNVWCMEVFGEEALACRDPFLRAHEQQLRMDLFHDSVGDDFVLEPWITQAAAHRTPGGIYGEPWGAETRRKEPGHGGAWKAEPFLKEWKDREKLVPPRHEIDEAATARAVQRLGDAVGDILPVNVDRGPNLSSFAGDISTTVAALRGLDQLMLDMYESPAELHALLAFLRDGILANQEQAEQAGHFTLTTQGNQAVPYADELEPMRPDSGPRTRADLWGFCAAQEYTLVSPAFHDEFLLRYQIPICEKYGLLHYGCCEDLTRKIGILRRIRNLRSIAVAPSADVRKCAEEIGSDYILSWRPSPTDMVCTGWDEDRIRRTVRDAVTACRGGFVHIHLKDVETLQGELERLGNWTRIVRDAAGDG